jgi:hypothetical protein
MSRRVRNFGLLATLFAIYAVSAKWGRGGRLFFSPDTLQSKSQSELLLPPTSIPVYRSGYTYSQYPLVAYLISKGYWKPSESGPARWLPMGQWNDMWRDGESTLFRALTRRTDLLTQWSEDHPDIAAAMWPYVLEQIRNGGREGERNAEGLMFFASYFKSVDEYQTALVEKPWLR